MNYFKTPKGTELPFLNLKGKDYLQVAHRLVWFREEKADWAILTEIKEHDETQSIVVAKILDSSGRILAMGTKQQSAKGFAAHLEKAESGAIGRALAFLGYGTAHAQELEEDAEDMSQLSDSPLPPKKPVEKSSGYTPSFGKYKGKDISKEPAHELENYVSFIKRSAQEKGQPLKGDVLQFVSQVESLTNLGQIKF